MTANFFTPNSVAIIGASENPKKLGFQLVKNILDSGYKGRVYPVNNKADENSFILKLKTYKAISDIHEIPDLTIISIPSDFVFDELLKSYSIGVRNFVMITAGFKEIGNTAGENLINQFIQMHPDANILGPNCLGFIDTATPINASFAASFPKTGNLSFYSQSGALCTAILDWSDKINMGFSKFVSLGNKNQMSEDSFLEERFIQNKPSFFYLESFNNGKEFIEKAQKISSPIVVLHPGRYTETAGAMQSHTGSMASNDKVVEEALKESNIIRAYGLEDITDLMMIFNFYPEYRDLNNIAIVSNAGGPGIITTDCIKDQGMQLAKLSEETQKRLSEKLPRTANIHNPVDVVGDALADRYGYALDIVLADSNVDAVIVLLTPQAMTQIDLTAEYIQRLAKVHNKVVVASFMGGKKVDKYEQYLFSYGIPYFDYPERAVWALSKLRKNKIQNKPHEQKTDAELDKTFAVTDIFRVPQEIVVNNIDEINTFLPNQKIAMKLISDQMWHKSDSGGVLLNLDSEEKRKNAFDSLNTLGDSEKQKNPEFKYEIHVQEMIHIEHELFMGAKRDPNFGNIVAFGIGGIYANLIDENMIFLEYANPEYILNKIQNSKAGEILSGARGQKPFDLNKVVDAVIKFHELLKTNTIINEVDINPLAIANDELIAVDIKQK